MHEPKQVIASPNNGLITERTVAIADPQYKSVERVAPRTNLLASYLEIPFMYKWLIIACTFLGALVGWAAIVLLPKAYESQAMLVLRVGRESVALDPSATTSATLTLQKTQEEEVVSALEILSSRQVAASVVEKLGADAILNGQLPGEGGNAENSPSMLASIKHSVLNALGEVLLKTGIKDEISNREQKRFFGSQSIRITAFLFRTKPVASVPKSRPRSPFGATSGSS